MTGKGLPLMLFKVAFVTYTGNLDPQRHIATLDGSHMSAMATRNAATNEFGSKWTPWRYVHTRERYRRWVSE